MANVQLYNSSGTQTTYSGVTSIVLPTSGGGTATFTEGGGREYITRIGTTGNSLSRSITFDLDDSTMTSVEAWVCILIGQGASWIAQNVVTSIIWAASGDAYITYANSSSTTGVTVSTTFTISNGQITITIPSTSGCYFMNNATYNLLAVS